MWRHPRTGDSGADSRDLSAGGQANGYPHGPRSSGQNLLINLVCESTDIYDRMGQLMNLGFGGFGPFIGGVPWAPPAGVTGTDDAYMVLTVNVPKSEAAKPRKFEITG